MDPKRRYSEEEVAKILDDATEAQSSGGQSLTSGQGMTLAELQDIGRQVGISEELIARAASRLDEPGTAVSPHREFLGATIGVGRTVQLDRRLTDAEWDRLVVDLRETFDARGHVRVEGSFRQWTNGNLQALLEPTESGERLRLKTVKGNARASLGVGAGLLGLAPVMYGFALLMGSGGAETPLMLGVVGAVLYGFNRVRLPNWASTRQLQMEGVAARLTAAIGAADPDPEEND